MVTLWGSCSPGFYHLPVQGLASFSIKWNNVQQPFIQSPRLSTVPGHGVGLLPQFLWITLHSASIARVETWPSAYSSWDIEACLVGPWPLLFCGHSPLPQVDVLEFFHLTDNELWSTWPENTERKTKFCPLKCSLDRRILQLHELSYCVEYNIDDAFEKEVDTEMREW